MDAVELIRDAPSWLGYALVGAPGVWAVYTRWQDRQKDERRDRTDLIKIAQDAAASVIEDLRAEVDRLRTEVDALERELSTARREHVETVASKDAKILLLEGELRAALARENALTRLLDEHGIPHPPPSEPFFRVPPGDGPAKVDPL